LTSLENKIISNSASDEMFDMDGPNVFGIGLLGEVESVLMMISHQILCFQMFILKI